MKKATLTFGDIRLSPAQTHKFRGYVGNLFSEYDLIHNHDQITGKHIYRYPLIQFKVIDNVPQIIALTSNAVDIFTRIFMTMNQMIIADRVIPVHEKDLKVETVEFGFSTETFMYELITPWIALNQKNYDIYNDYETRQEKDDLLKRILTGNILSMSKSLGIHLDHDQKIQSDLRLEHQPVNLKNQKMLGFKGMFKTNFILPDDVGLGKSVSRGFGTIKQIL